MSEREQAKYLWIPGEGPDDAALKRMRAEFSKPKTPMGEAWFMSEERQLYPELRGDLDQLTDEQLTEPLAEIASGTSSFGRLDEWTEWYHFLLPQLLDRQWGRYIYHPVELLVTGFMAQHPDSNGSLPYPAFRADALATLGRYIMAPHFWQGAQSEIPKCFNKWRGPTGICGWYWAEGLLSASLFFCMKYLARDDVRSWFESVTSIPNRYWQVQVITWLVGAHPILSDEISQPAQFPESDLLFGVGWNWSHTLDGNYSGNYDPPIQSIPFLPVENRKAVLQVARSMETEEFFEDLLTDPDLEAVAAETPGLSERFAQLYGGGSLAC